MTNYKPRHSETSFFMEPLNHIYKSFETPVTIQNQGDSLTTVGISMHDMITAASYVVPTGKTFKLLGLSYLNKTGVRLQTIFQSDDENAKTNEVIKFRYLSQNADTTINKIGIPSKPTFTAGKYINIDVDNVTNAGYPLYLYGVEY